MLIKFIAASLFWAEKGLIYYNCMINGEHFDTWSMFIYELN